MTIAGNAAFAEERSEPREPVLYRTRLSDSCGREAPATLVNVSPGGFMARTDTPHAVGETVTVELPRLGRRAAIVRWSLGGRIGCQLLRPCGLSDYHLLLQALPKG